MKQMMLKSLAYFFIFSAGLGVSSCKNKSKDSNVKVNVDSNSAKQNAPVEISSDEALNKGVKDAINDYPGVNASVNNGEVTLTGEIEREKLSKLLPAIHGLNPRKVNQNLTVKD